MSAATAQSTRSKRDDGEDDRRARVHHQRQHVLDAVDGLQRLGQQRAEEPDEQHALRGAEVAAVDAGQQRADRHEHRHPARTVRGGLPFGVDPRRRARRSPPSAPGAPRRRALIRGCRTTSTTATAMSTGTTASNASAGSHSRSSAPATAPSALKRRHPDQPRALAGQLAPVAPRARDAAEHEADVVGHVRRHRRVPEREQRRERDQRPGADDGVHQPGRRTGSGDRDARQKVHRPRD